MIYAQFDDVYRKIAKIGEGSYGQVYLCQKKQNQSTEIESNFTIANQNSQPNLINVPQNQQQFKKKNCHQFYAIKKLKHLSNPKHSQQVNNTTFQECREVLIMRQLNNIQNILKIEDIVQKTKGQKINHYLVLEYGVQLIQFAKHKEINLSKVMIKTIIKQLVEGLAQIHKRNFIHRDFKPDNIFLNKAGIVKIGDFSLSRQLPNIYKSKLQTKEEAMINESQQQNQKKMTGNVTTRYYRAPQIIFGDKYYDKSIDIWSLGCTLAEIILHQPLFPGESDINQLEKIFSVVGYPQDNWPQAENLPYYFQFSNEIKEKGVQNILPDSDQDLVDLVRKCLQLNPKNRPSIQDIKNHKYFLDSLERNQQLQKISFYLNQKKINSVLAKLK